MQMPTGARGGGDRESEMMQEKRVEGDAGRGSDRQRQGQQSTGVDEKLGPSECTGRGGRTWGQRERERGRGRQRYRVRERD